MIIHFYFQCVLMMMMMMMMMNILTSGGLSFIECLLAEVLQKAVSIAFSVDPYFCSDVQALMSEKHGLVIVACLTGSLQVLK